MKLANFFFASQVSAGYFQQYQNLTPEEKEERQALCEAKAEETIGAFPIENGLWNCPNFGLLRPKIRCFPQCEEGFLPDWTIKPKKNRPRFLARCGAPATIAKK